jgi:prepilin-type N-terminal cleavage/methylation domain-containing protein
MNDNSNSERGLTLIELLVSVIIISIGLMALSGIFPMGSRARLEAESITRAMELAEEKIEELRVMGYEGMRLEYGDTSSPWAPNDPRFDTVRNYIRWWSFDTTAWGLVDDNAFMVILSDSVSYPVPGGRGIIGLKTQITPNTQ